MKLTVTGPVRNEGSIIVFEGINEKGKTVYFAVDHRPASHLIEGLKTSNDDIEVEVESWQVLGGGS